MIGDNTTGGGINIGKGGIEYDEGGISCGRGDIAMGGGGREIGVGVGSGGWDLVVGGVTNMGCNGCDDLVGGGGGGDVVEVVAGGITNVGYGDVTPIGCNDGGSIVTCWGRGGGQNSIVGIGSRGNRFLFDILGSARDYRIKFAIIGGTPKLKPQSITGSWSHSHVGFLLRFFIWITLYMIS